MSEALFIPPPGGSTNLLSLEHQPAPGVEVITFAGYLDVLSARSLRRSIQDSLDRDRNRILVDLSVVELIDSAGMSALVNGRRLAQRAGGDLRLVRPRAAEATRIFDLTMFDQIFKMGSSAQSMIDRWGHS